MSTALDLLATLHPRGVELVIAGDRLLFRPVEAVTPEEREALQRFKAELLALLQPRLAPREQYRLALRRWWTLAAQGPEADRAAIARTYQEIIKLIDEVGSPTATRLRRQWARQWWQETGICPYCGEPGPYDDPELRGEAR